MSTFDPVRVIEHERLQLVAWESTKKLPARHREQLLQVELGDRVLSALRGCPAWCTDHYTLNEDCHYHSSRIFTPRGAGAQVYIDQRWTSWDGGDKEPLILLNNNRISKPETVKLTPLQARALADLFAGGGAFHDGIAAALTEAADALDRMIAELS